MTLQQGGGARARLNGRRPPGLLVKTTVAVSLVTTALLLVVVFVVTLNVREQVRQGVTDNLESSQRMFAALEARRQRELRAQATTLAESPTLKAALDTYIAELKTSDAATRTQLLNTISIELNKLAERFEADAIVLVDTRQTRWPLPAALPDGGRRAAPSTSSRLRERRAVTTASSTLVAAHFALCRAVAADNDTRSGRSISQRASIAQYANSLAELSPQEIVIVSDGVLLASSLAPEVAREFEAAIVRTNATDGTIDIGGETYAFRRLFQVGDTSFFALGSIDELSRPAMWNATRSLALHRRRRDAARPRRQFSAGAACSPSLSAAVGLARKNGRGRDVDARLPLTGSSRELDTLTETFNAHMASVAAAEADKRGGIYRDDSGAGRRARRAGSLHGRPLRTRQRFLDRDRPGAEFARR